MWTLKKMIVEGQSTVSNGHACPLDMDVNYRTRTPGKNDQFKFSEQN